MTPRRLTAARVLGAAPLLGVVVVLGAALALLVASPAQAAGYRYWSFWQSDGRSGGAWGYATQGPATARPADGEVNGFRFSVSTDSADSAKPRTAPDFATLCADVPAKAGTKRVGIVIDFGTPADAPEGDTPPTPDRRTACAQVDPSATSADALAAVAKPLRYNSDALLCAISSYPKSGCGEQVSAGTPAMPPLTRTAPAATDSPTATVVTTDSGSGPSVGVIAGVAAVLALGAAAFRQSRRRRG
ncbi:SCO2322 family protein [Streptomyces sp. NPDC059909]|uniref:SCO2322 family protein n=1 Tax=Streptomyces sp. NPDC059909 TaxID=3346998 RepID=UPI00366A4A56